MKLWIKKLVWILICGITFVSISNILGFSLIQSTWKSSFTAYSRLSPKEASYWPIKTAVTKVCGDHHENLVAKNSTYESGYLIMNKSVYYCNIPKCGSSFLGVFLKKIFSIDRNINSTDVVYKIKRQINIKNPYAFMFVREPYSRLLSAYENKFFHPGEKWKTLGIEVIREVRKRASLLGKHLGHDVSFFELVEYVVKLHEQGRQLNPHLAPMHTLCNPCKQRFDFIGRLETMTEDLVQLTSEWKSRGLISMETKFIPAIESETKYKRSFGRIGHMFNVLKEYKNLPSYKLFQRTWSSYQIRGMILKNYKLPFSIPTVDKVNKDLYKQAVDAAMYASSKYGNELKDQRKEALKQAYGTVPMGLLNKLRNIFITDCLLFGYNDRPEILFNRSVAKQPNDHDYFTWL